MRPATPRTRHDRPRPLRRLLTFLGLVAIAVSMIGFATTPSLAHADSDDDAITRYAVRADVQPDGSVQVNLDFDFDFGGDDGHGPYLTLPERMAIEGDTDHWRSLPISDITASSPTAPYDLEIERADGAVLIKIGDENVDLTGTHTYRVSYRMAGAINPAAPGSGLDEFSWNPIGTEWEIPLRNVSVTVTTPVALERTGCFTGRDYGAPCPEAPLVSDRTATFTPGADLEPGTGLQVVAGMPPGSFPGVTPILTQRITPARFLGTEPVSLGIAAATLLGGAAAAIALVRRRGNRQFAGVSPGEVPESGPLGQAKHAHARTGDIPVRTTPPDGVAPGLVGVLDDTVAGLDDVMATIIDLAVRGHLQVAEGEQDSRRLVRLTPPAGDELKPYEATLLQHLFGDGDEVDLSKPGSLTEASTATYKEMYAEVTDRRGWFHGNPTTVRTRWVFTGLLVMVGGVAATIVLGLTAHLGFVGIAVMAVGLLICILSTRAPGRTALGTAVHLQSLGFKKYLGSVGAEQVQIAPGVDLFSLYLPYAMMWGLTERWTGVFADQAARGAAVVTPAWYLGTSPLHWGDDGASVLGGINGLSSSATAAMTADTSSSGGASGSSGGGGVGGGGGGGW